MSAIKVDLSIDCVGLACPLPVVKTKKKMDEMNAGEVLEVTATDKGSVADLQGWAKRIGHQYIGLKEVNGVFHHFIRKVEAADRNAELQYPHIMTNEDIQKKLKAGDKINLIDVREPAEYAFGHMTGAISIPLGELEGRLGELSPDDEYAVVCRTGIRSDLACQLLLERGFAKVKNVKPGMAEWTGSIEKVES
ncbi:sulfurtransferase TusA family protein [Paenibacillus sp. PL91]|uniref:sulfurtransferase TusA family protein n=1 Tax=Paenibacillus sp. PL91 TaxID=2729538 RepID=UPI001CB9BAC3|nr:sulfurtransferase TusA family protein [Paenibacillus sp. PL91]